MFFFLQENGVLIATILKRRVTFESTSRKSISAPSQLSWRAASLTRACIRRKANIIPAGFHNNIRWNMGHVYLDQYLWIEALTKEKDIDLEALKKWFGFGTSPNHFDDETPSFEELKKYLAQRPEQLKEQYGHRLSEEFPPIDMGMQTIEQVLLRTIFHEGMHLQAILTIYRC